jgi:DNA end-binding protein Ku
MWLCARYPRLVITMARAVWTGALSFGLVSIPVGLYSATKEHEVRFHQFEKGTNSRIRYRRVNSDTGDEVDYDDIVKGAEIDGGEYVVLSDDELEDVAPKQTRAIEISDFVDVAAIDPVHFQKSYYLGPRDNSARKPYALLNKAIEKSGRVGIASFVLRNKEYLAVIRPYQGVLMLETMYFADEVRPVEDVIDNPPDAKSLGKQDLEMAQNLIESMTVDWDPEKYHDRYTERVRDLVEAKSKDEKFDVPEEEEQGADVVDLTAALRASVDRVRGKKSDSTEGSGSSSKSSKSGSKSSKSGSKSGRSAAKKSSSDPAAELSELSKQELYDLAQELGIAGRSKMSRKDLERAITDAKAEQVAS